MSLMSLPLNSPHFPRFLCFAVVALMGSTPVVGRAEPPALKSDTRVENAAIFVPQDTFQELKLAGAKLFGGSPRESERKENVENDGRGTSAPSVRKAALAALPLDRLNAEQQQKAREILDSISFFRRLPRITFVVEPDVYSYFTAHPDVAVSIWRSMKISKLQMWQTGKYEYEADSGDGSTGILDVLYTSPEKSLCICTGNYKSPLMSKPIEAKSLLMLQTAFTKEADGTVYVTHRADLYVSFPSQTVDAVAKIFSPLTVAMTDRTFAEVSLFLKMMSMAMAKRPDWVEQIAKGMDGVPEIRKGQVLELTTQVHTAAQKRSIEKTLEKNPSEEPPRISIRPPAAGRPVSEEKPAVISPSAPGGNSPAAPPRIISVDPQAKEIK